MISSDVVSTTGIRVHFKNISMAKSVFTILKILTSLLGKNTTVECLLRMLTMSYLPALRNLM